MLTVSQITASMSAGSFLGALAAGAICDSVGRRKSLMLASVIWIIGSAIQCSSQNVAQLIVGRIVSGLAVGITSSQVVSLSPALSKSSRHRFKISCLEYHQYLLLNSSVFTWQNLLQHASVVESSVFSNGLSNG